MGSGTADQAVQSSEKIIIAEVRADILKESLLYDRHHPARDKSTLSQTNQIYTGGQH